MNPLAQQWADNMTANYDDLSLKDTIFGQLRNCMDLAILAALIFKENLAAKAGYQLPALVWTTQFAGRAMPRAAADRYAGQLRQEGEQLDHHGFRRGGDRPWTDRREVHRRPAIGRAFAARPSPRRPNAGGGIEPSLDKMSLDSALARSSYTGLS